MAAAGVQTARTQLRLILDSKVGFLFFGKGLRTVRGLHTDCSDSTRTVLGVLADWGVQSKVLCVGSRDANAIFNRYSLTTDQECWNDVNESGVDGAGD